MQDQPALFRCATLTGLPEVLGPLTVFEADGAVVGLAFAEGAAALKERLARLYGPATVVPEQAMDAAAALRRYFDGDLQALSGDRGTRPFSIEPRGTLFQARVWGELRRIPAGRTCSYGELAVRVGAPTACRAVAGANAANPIPIFVPCHRVIAADGKLSGYSSGVARKRWLLEHEAAA